ncbi:MAG: YfbM family protein [bacterium]|nr:YfbM family protein [bacterium]
MSMIGNFVAINDADFTKLTNNPKDIEVYLYPEEDDFENVGEKNIDIDKAWHAIHFILTRSQWEGDPPASDVILGGQEYGPDVGYGPARILHKDKVVKVAEYLNALPDNCIASGYDVSMMLENEIYPDFWGELEDGGAEILEYVEEYFSEVKNFYTFAAQKGLHVIKYLN